MVIFSREKQSPLAIGVHHYDMYDDVSIISAAFCAFLLEETCDLLLIDD
jgi:hypothetical protein